MSLTVLTVLWNWFSPVAVILMVRVPNRPSRPNTMSIPSVRSNVCTRRSPPARARGSLASPTGPQPWDCRPPGRRRPPGKGRMRFSSIRPLRSISHDLAHTGCHRIGVDDGFDRLAPVVETSGFEDARGAKGALTDRGPEREVSHTRQPPEAYTTTRLPLVAGMIGRTDVDSLSFTTPAMACPTSRREAPGGCHGRKEGQVHGSSGRINNETYSLGNVLYVIGSLATGSHA